MPSRRELILRAVKTAVAGTALFTTCDRSRTRPLAVAQTPAASIYPNEEPVNYESQNGRVLRTLSFRVAIRMRGTDEDLDPLHVAVTGALAGQSFGGLAVDTKEAGSEWVFEEADEVLVGCDVAFVTEYFTAEADEESAG